MTDFVGDHLASLCFSGTSLSSGAYSPRAFDLRLQGLEQPVDHIVYLHEVHHGALNDSTAWGTVLHIYARLPEFTRDTFRDLLDACRTTHESFATFASVEIASARHGPIGDVMSAYPSYVPLYRAALRMLDGIEGPNRRQLAINALARACMQTPVLDVLGELGTENFTLASVRNIDRPDCRWNWFVRKAPAGILASAARAADRSVIAAHGSSALRPDAASSDLYDATLRAYDDIWKSWEICAYDELRRTLAGSSANTLTYDGHQEGTRAVLERIQAAHGDLGLRAQLPERDESDDAMLAGAVLQQVRHAFAPGLRYHAAVGFVDDPEEIVEIAEQSPAIAGAPRMIVDARPWSRLQVLYQWESDNTPNNTESAGGLRQVVAVRFFESADPSSRSLADKADRSEDRVVHLVLRYPRDMDELVRRWGERSRVIACVGASCLADREWAGEWFRTLRSAGVLFVLVDVEPDRFIPRWAKDGRFVRAIRIAVNDISGRRTALLMTADDGVTYWLVIGDDVTVNLFFGILSDHLAHNISADVSAFESIHEELTAVITHVLATESFSSFDALAP